MAWGAVSYADVPGLGHDDLLDMTQSPVEIASIPVRDDTGFGRRPVFSEQLAAAAGAATAPGPSVSPSRPRPGVAAVVDIGTLDLLAGLNRRRDLTVDNAPDAQTDDQVHDIGMYGEYQACMGEYGLEVAGASDGDDDSELTEGPAASFDLPSYDGVVSTAAYDDKPRQLHRLIRVTNTGGDDDSAAEPDTTAAAVRAPGCQNPLTAKVAMPAIDAESIMRAKERFGRFVRQTSLCDPATANPWALVERLSEAILDECLLDVSREVGAELDAVVDAMVAGELKVA